MTTRRQYDGNALIAEYNASNVLQRRYVHGPGSDEPLLWYEGSVLTDRRWYHADERGSVVAVSGGSGAALGLNRYDEYGIPQSTNYSTRLAYTGQTWLPELGMYYYKARIYSASLGRFMQTDPIGYDDQVNLYAYVGNDPVNKVDPMGMCTGSLIKDKDGGCKGGGFVQGAGSCIGNCESTRDSIKGALSNDTLRRSKFSAGTFDPLSKEDLRKLSRILLSTPVLNQIIKSVSWSYANKKESGFWLFENEDGKIKAGHLMKGEETSINYVVLRKDNFEGFHDVSLFHAHLDDIRPSQQDLSIYRNQNVIGLIYSLEDEELSYGR